MDITLDTLLEEGKQIRNGFGYKEGYTVGRGYVMGHSTFSKRSEYETWKNKVIRFLAIEYGEDRCIDDFDAAVKLFESQYYKDYNFDKLLGVLEGCRVLPTKIKTTVKLQKNNPSKINIINQNAQYQNQEQIQSIAINFFIEAIKEELNGRQIKEIKDIFTNEPDSQKAKIKLLDRIKSFGSDVASNVLANILTNPAIWGNL